MILPASRGCRVRRRARGDRRPGPLPDPAQRRRSDGEKAENFVLAEAPVDDPSSMRTLDRAPPRRAPRGRRRVRGSPGAQLPARGAHPGRRVAAHRRRLRRAHRTRVRRGTVRGRSRVAIPSGSSPSLRLGFTSFITPSRVYDYDRGYRRTAAAQIAAGARRLRSGTTTSSAANGRPPRTAPGFRCRSCGARTCRPGRRRLCCTGTAPTKPASIPGSR